MKSALLKAVTILHPESSLNGKKTDVLIENGIIAGFDVPGDENTRVIDCAGKYLSPGFVDLNANFGEPGLETKEDLDSGIKAAAAGGFTAVVAMPNTQPPVHSKAEVSYIVNKTKNAIVDVFPLGTISYNREGKDLAELYDMNMAGAVGFTDGDKPVTDSGLMSRALLYAKGFNGLVMSYAEDSLIAGKGKMNEGEVSTYLGMKGIPSLAEEVMIVRDIFLAEYNDSKIHFSTISTAKSVELIREAKKKGLKITCDVAAHNLVFSDEAVSGFDSHFKVKPPLRTQKDIKALIAGLEDGTIDAIVSQHTPHEIEHKNVEFEIASYGIIGLQTVLPLLVKAGLSPEMMVEKLAVGPRKILGKQMPGLTKGSTANFVVFDTESEWEFNSDTNFSKSVNSPMFGQKLKGKVSLVVNNNQTLNF
ncbi:amidohydrolase family protein [Pedobacter sp. HMF7647]|uniref:Amidohydrolase family protein n=1 Tax=Hufsiella arboris TaxID=2695275 RepID=A0A7K1YFP1_9SPHI|nr:dihydroorotase [Hufsiella arboris]MXV53270.1 amidohydrolase family protein [Hufsiella arboris]